MNPVFYDIEASGLDGYPIEVGWAFLDEATGKLCSEAYLIKPDASWDIISAWDSNAEALHGITLGQLQKSGLSAFQVATNMNRSCADRELFADSPLDEGWLQQLFDAAGIDQNFTVRRTSADTMINQQASKLQINRTTLLRLEEIANTLAPRTHRAEADANNLAAWWLLMTQGGKWNF